MKIHDWKIVPEYFVQLLDGSRPFVIIKNDKKYKTGDTVILKEWNGIGYSGKEIHGKIRSLADDGCTGIEKGYAVCVVEVFHVLI